MVEHKNLKQIVGDTYRSVYSYLKPISNVSSFFEKGTLTPQEFVDSGDFLVHRFKTWRWQKAHDKRSVSYLPYEKQFLLMRNVPCQKRVRDLIHLVRDSKIVENDWVYPNYAEDNDEIYLTKNKQNEFISLNELLNDNNKPGNNNSHSCDDDDVDNNEDDGEVIDFYNYNICHVAFEENDSAAVNDCASVAEWDKLEKENTMRIRTYDISITYDKYYQTPRIWLSGYNEHGVPLKIEEIYEDTLTDYSNQTVTHEIHPYTGIISVSIHPCKQADMMSKVAKQWTKENIPPRHDLSILILLKNISTIIPTIEYDFTMDIEMSMHY